MSSGQAGEITSPLRAPDFTINIEGSRYVADGGRRYRPIRHPDLGDVWDDIYASAANPVIEFSRGTFTVDAPLDIQNYGTTILGQGPESTILQLGAGVNDDVIQMTTYYYNVAIRNIGINGNRANNTAGKGIEFNCDTDWTGEVPYRGWFYIDNIMVTQCDEDGIYIRSTDNPNTESTLSNFRVWDNDGHATTGHQIFYSRIFDSFIGYGGRNSTSSLWMAGGCASNHIGNIYIGGGISKLLYLSGAASGYPNQGNHFHDLRVDNALGIALCLEDYNSRNWFDNCKFTHLNQAVTDNTLSCIYSDDNSSYNHYVGCWMGHFNIASTNRWKYAYEDAGSSDYNFLQGCYTGYGVPPTVGGNAEHFATLEHNAAANSVITNCFKDNGDPWNTAR